MKQEDIDQVKKYQDFLKAAAIIDQSIESSKSEINAVVEIIKSATADNADIVAAVNNLQIDSHQLSEHFKKIDVVFDAQVERLDSVVEQQSKNLAMEIEKNFNLSNDVKKLLEDTIFGKLRDAYHMAENSHGAIKNKTDYLLEVAKQVEKQTQDISMILNPSKWKLVTVCLAIGLASGLSFGVLGSKSIFDSFFNEKLKFEISNLQNEKILLVKKRDELDQIYFNANKVEKIFRDKVQFQAELKDINGKVANRNVLLLKQSEIKAEGSATKGYKFIEFK